MRSDPIEIEPDAWCEWCGDPLPEPEERHARRRFCGRKCKDDYRNDLRAEAARALLIPKPCKWCSTVFKPTRAFQVYCRKQCNWDANNARAKIRKL